MANADRPRGFWPIRHMSGGEIRPNAMHQYDVDADGSTAMYRGDLVKIMADGNIEPAEADIGTACIGVFWGARYKDADGDWQYSDSIAATKTGFTSIKADVYDDPNIIFGVQADSGTAVAETDIGATANHVAGAGDSTRKLSGHELDSSDIGTGAQLKIVGLVPTANNSWLEHADLEVIINEHHFKAAVAGV